MALYEATPIEGSKSGLGEGTLWDERRESFLWVDAFEGLIKTYKPSNKTFDSHKISDFVSYIGKRESDGYVVALGDRFALTDQDFEIIDEVEMQVDLNLGQTNDGNIDSHGSLWIGVAEAVSGSKTGNLRRIDPKYQSKIYRREVQISNGMDWSLDGKVMYYIDSALRQVSRYEIDTRNGEPIQELPAIDLSDAVGLPDGMCTDSLGNLWIAFWGSGQIRNYTPEGRLINIVQTPTALTTCLSFGGSNLNTMFITSAQDRFRPEYAFNPESDEYGGMCFQVELPVSGKFDNYFKG